MAVSKKCYLLDIPVEIREMILSWAVIAPKCIYPNERDSSPGKFTRTRNNLCDGHENDVESPLTALELGLSCRLLFAEVIGTNLLYQNNEFRFFSSFQAVRFLKYLDSGKWKCISSVWLSCPKKDPPTQALNLLSATNVQNLELFVRDPVKSGDPTFKELCQLRGLKSFTITYSFFDSVMQSTSFAYPLRIIALQPQYQIALEKLSVWTAIMQAREVIFQPRTKRTDRRAAAAASISCYCPNPRVLRYDRVNICDCQREETSETPHDRNEAWPKTGMCASSPPISCF